ncbi:MAG: hypothetical protein II886_03945 [Prevotella sp.]|nr:hypothetical protein [Prevotella sp.]
MEKQQDMTPLKARSYRSVLTTGFKLYMEKFRQFFKASWLMALLLALVFGTVAALLLLMYPASMRAFILLLCMPLAIPVVYALLRKALRRHRDFWYSTKGSFALRLRHCGLLLIVLFASILLVLLASCVVLIPAGILCLANQAALQGMMMGDPSGMPSYMTWLTLGTFVLTAFALFYVSQVLLIHYYYACGSIEAREAERQKQKQLIQSI